MPRPRLRALHAENGTSLIELIVVMALLGFILSSVTGLFTAGMNAEADQNRRFQAQSSARLGLTKLRREVHAACGVAPGWTSSSVTLRMMADADTSVTPPSCLSGANSVTWCATGSGTRYGLSRVKATSCTGALKQYADYLTTNALFTYFAQNVPAGLYTLPRLQVDLQVNVDPAKPGGYRLIDDMALRNGQRS